MAQARKFASLPGLDTAPDLYETPEFADDASTFPSAASAHSDSQSNDSDGDIGIDRQHLQTNQARSIFRPARIDAHNTDFSDRVSRRKKSYRTKSGRGRHRSVEDEALSDSSADEAEELDRKIARLQREIREVKLAMERKQDDSDQSALENVAKGQNPVEMVQKLSDTLDTIYLQRHSGESGAEVQFGKATEKWSKGFVTRHARPIGSGTQSEGQPSGKTHASRSQQLHALAKISELDSRLASMEKSVGLTGLNMPDLAQQPPRPVLFTLDALEKQLSQVQKASTGSLDTVSRKLRQLTQDAERLDEIRKANASTEQTQSTPIDLGKLTQQDIISNVPSIDDPHQLSKIGVLYSTLSTIESLAPTLPLVLDRLRTLRLIHTSAGHAFSAFNEVERRLDKQQMEIESWRAALEELEKKLEQNQDQVKNNIKVIGMGMKYLEERLSSIK